MRTPRSRLFLVLLGCLSAAACKKTPAGTGESSSGSTTAGGTTTGATTGGTTSGTAATCIYDDAHSTYDGPCVLAK